VVQLKTYRGKLDMEHFHGKLVEFEKGGKTMVGRIVGVGNARCYKVKIEDERIVWVSRRKVRFL